MIRSRVQDTKPDEEKPAGDYESNLLCIHPDIPRATPDGQAAAARDGYGNEHFPQDPLQARVTADT